MFFLSNSFKYLVYLTNLLLFINKIQTILKSISIFYLSTLEITFTLIKFKKMFI